MNTLEEIVALLLVHAKPKCAELTPFTVLEGDTERGYVKLEFEEQPAFGNHFGHIQGGFLSAIMDVPISCAAFLKTGHWLPMIEMKTSCLAPAKIGRTVADAQVLRSGQNIVFLEGHLWGADGRLAVHATATLLGHASSPLVDKK